MTGEAERPRQEFKSANLLRSEPGSGCGARPRLDPHLCTTAAPQASSARSAEIEPFIIANTNSNSTMTMDASRCKKRFQSSQGKPSREDSGRTWAGSSVTVRPHSVAFWAAGASDNHKILRPDIKNARIESFSTANVRLTPIDRRDHLISFCVTCGEEDWWSRGSLTGRPNLCAFPSFN